MAGIKLTHIPYKGSSPALTDLLGGHVAIYFSSLPPAIALVREGKVRALAVTGPKRSPSFPDLPTVAEAALPGYEAVLHYGIVAPAGTPRAIIDKLNAALNAALAEARRARAHRGRRRRAAAGDAGRLRRRHRPRGDQVVEDREAVGREGGVRSRDEVHSILSLCCCSRLPSPVPALAQDYPTRTVTLVVPYPPGGGVDAMARIVAEQAVRRARPAGGGRQSRRRQRARRHARGAEGRARRLHAAARPHRLDLDQSEPLCQCRLRSAQGFRRDRADRLDAGRADRASVVPGEDDRATSSRCDEGIPASSISAPRRSAPAATCRPSCSSRWPASMSRSSPTRARRR